MAISAATYNVYVGADLLKILAATSPEQLQTLSREVLADVTATDFAQRARGIAAHLGSVGWPDLVGCQEVATWSTGSPGAEPRAVVDFTAELVAAFAEAGASYDVVASAPSFGGRTPLSASTFGDLLAHNVTFARRDTVSVTRVRGGAFSARLELPTHLAGVSFGVVRSWTVVSAVVDGRGLELANTHLETYDADIRAAQLGELLGQLADGPAVVLGDLNEQAARLRLPIGWTDAWVAVHGTAGGFTCGEGDPLLRRPVRRLDQRIDYVLARDLAVRSCQVIGGEQPMPTGLWPSDHAGVVAVVA